MVYETKKLMENLNELMNLAVKQMDVSNIMAASEEDFAAIKMMFKLAKDAEDLAVQQAVMIEEMDRKLTKTLSIVEKLAQK